MILPVCDSELYMSTSNEVAKVKSSEASS